MFFNIPNDGFLLFIDLELSSLKRLLKFGRELFGGDGVRPVVLPFRWISPIKTGVLPFRFPRVGLFRLLIGHAGPTLDGVELFQLSTSI